MRYFILIAAWTVLLGGCRETPAEAVNTAGAQETSSAMEVPAPVALVQEARAVTDSWPEFKQFEARMDVLAGAGNPEEAGLLLEELIGLLTDFETAAFPSPFDRISVRSRLTLVKTYLLKAQAALHYRTDYTAPVAEAFEAYNGLREQFNHIVSSNLDPSIFDDE